MTDDEARRLARSGAVAGLCPITEASLGDGVFNAPLYFAERGAFGVGSDSNVEIGVAAELKQLEYAQRLRDRARNVCALAAGSTGRALYERALAGGAQALGAAERRADGRRRGRPRQPARRPSDARRPQRRRNSRRLDLRRRQSRWSIACGAAAARWSPTAVTSAREPIAARYAAAMRRLAQ